MPRTRKFFRLKNSSKDSGLSFHCCGKPEDLLDEPLDLVNQKRQPRGKAEVTKPETKISSLLFRSTASSSNLKRKSRVERTKLWAKKYIDPHINDKSLANEEKKHSTNQDPITPFADEDSGDDMNPKLRPARSMPLLNQPTFSNATHHHRRRSKCLSSFSFSGLDALVGSHSDPSKTSQQKSVLRFPLVDPDPMDTATTRTDSAKSTSSKLHTSIFSKNSKFSSFLSATSWNSFLSHRQEKE
ncbi:hypothetical protein PCASD_06422 [Puccinia coronata f. sp. avenae]|uniref:Uncharacterized protein n=1 Tax=Puccinia coronata f. sp. avenae TaxID=200324 RepID=A0A2N5UFN0_9BASI|nr:hypothetical protein PCASD_06422 [Puccinia coronata f. sp. avenae]